ncbi:MAG: 2-C-methyl-D-erythritol 4-phosphate cytidylyltransferase [Bacteroidetes bacterium]|nr:2-C-methyl-D-erythritol 4-phosphate cytidylyltransferase [Bacteroidota bacterium]
MSNSEKYAIIVAGGKGERMGSAVPKQFLPLGGKPVLYYSIKAFMDAFPDINLILVLPHEQMSYAQMVLESFDERVELTIVSGGTTRYHSVQNGLKQVDKNGIVFVHDGVRPLVSSDLIRRCYAQAMEKGSAVPAVPVTDSLRIVDESGSRAVDREQMRSIQTPQTFRSDIILPAFAQEYQVGFTDEATVCEAYGTKVFLTEGERSNIKVTTPEDMIIAEALLAEKQPDA